MRTTLKHALVGVAASISLGGAAESASAQFTMGPIERDLFPPMGVVIPLHASDMLGANTLEQMGLEGRVRAVTTRMAEFPDRPGAMDDREATTLRFSRAGFLEHMKSGYPDYTNIEMEFQHDRRAQGSGVLHALSIAMVGKSYAHQSRMGSSLTYEVNASGEPVSFSFDNPSGHSFRLTRSGPGEGGAGRITGTSPGLAEDWVFELDRRGRVVSIEGFHRPDSVLSVTRDGNEVAFEDSETGELMVRLTLDEHGDPVDLRGPGAVPMPQPNNPSDHSRRTFERDEHGNWTSLLIEHEFEDGWKQMMLFVREFEYWDE